MEARSKLSLWLTLLACLAGALSAPAAWASPELEDEGAIGGFTLKASNGYKIVVLASARPHAGGKGEVTLVVGRKGSAARYTAPAMLAATLPPTPAAPHANTVATAIRANLGELGRISLDLKPSG